MMDILTGKGHFPLSVTRIYEISLRIAQPCIGNHWKGAKVFIDIFYLQAQETKSLKLSLSLNELNHSSIIKSCQNVSGNQSFLFFRFFLKSVQGK